MIISKKVSLSQRWDVVSNDSIKSFDPKRRTIPTYRSPNFPINYIRKTWHPIEVKILLGEQEKWIEKNITGVWARDRSSDRDTMVLLNNIHLLNSFFNMPDRIEID